jgi:hypothetical protein
VQKLRCRQWIYLGLKRRVAVAMALLAESLQSLKHPACGTSFCLGLAVLIRSMYPAAKRAASSKAIAQFHPAIAL